MYVCFHKRTEDKQNFHTSPALLTDEQPLPETKFTQYPSYQQIIDIKIIHGLLDFFLNLSNYIRIHLKNK